MLKALLFDLDGTLADTNPLHRSTWEKFLEPYGYNVTWDFYRDNISGRVGQEMVLDLFPDLSPEEAQEMSDAKDARFRERAGELEALPGLRDFVTKGREKGMKMALVTNAPEENVLAVLRALNLEGVFEAVIRADDVDPVSPTRPPTRPPSKPWVSRTTRPSPSRTRPPASPPPSPPESPRLQSLRPRNPKGSKSTGSSWSSATSPTRSSRLL